MPTNIFLCQVTKPLLHGAWRGSTWTATEAVRFAARRTMRIQGLARRAYSTQRSAKAAAQTSRFRRPDAPPAEPPIDSVSETPVPEFTPQVTVSRPQPPPRTPRPVDLSSKEYKQAERKFTSVIVALPILFVTSYYLYDRLVLGHMPPNSPAHPSRSPEPRLES
ncbi:hypothetical protein VTK56DRAFT_3637 [Thermocarpiscus australiensis]